MNNKTNKIKIGIGIGITMIGLFLLPMALSQNPNEVNALQLNFRMYQQNHTTLNNSGYADVFYYSVTGAVTETLTTVPIDLNMSGLTIQQSQREIAIQIANYGKNTLNYTVVNVIEPQYTKIKI